MTFFESITVGLDERSYPINIGADIFEHLPEYLMDCQFPANTALISNTTVYNLYGELVLSVLEDIGMTVSVITIEDGEQYKNLSSLSHIYDELVTANIDRGSGIIALGGGVVGDIAGFAAATFLRGIPYIQIPTTLLAQVDSSVGGKTAINHPHGKNLIGAFNQPKMVCIDINFLQTLPEREFSAGIAEVVKYGIIRDRQFFKWLKKNYKALLQKDAAALIHAIKTSCQIKADIVEIDEKESSLRATLNFGHTFGHAVESLTSYRQFLHGEAVSIGMVFAARASHALGYCTRDDVDEITEILTYFSLPVVAPVFKIEDYLQAMMHDKKVKGGQLNMIFNQGIGQCSIESVINPEQLLKQVLS